MTVSKSAIRATGQERQAKAPYSFVRSPHSFARSHIIPANAAATFVHTRVWAPFISVKAGRRLRLPSRPLEASARAWVWYSQHGLSSR